MRLCCLPAIRDIVIDCMTGNLAPEALHGFFDALSANFKSAQEDDTLYMLDYVGPKGFVEQACQQAGRYSLPCKGHWLFLTLKFCILYTCTMTSLL